MGGQSLVSKGGGNDKCVRFNKAHDADATEFDYNGGKPISTRESSARYGELLGRGAVVA
jgi:hypothetical protein